MISGGGGLLLLGGRVAVNSGANVRLPGRSSHLRLGSALGLGGGLGTTGDNMAVCISDALGGISLRCRLWSIDVR